MWGWKEENMFLHCAERFFSHFKVDFQDFYLLFYIFSTAIRDRTLTFIKKREMLKNNGAKGGPHLLCVFSLDPNFI